MTRELEMNDLNMFIVLFANDLIIDSWFTFSLSYTLFIGNLFLNIMKWCMWVYISFESTRKFSIVTWTIVIIWICVIFGPKSNEMTISSLIDVFPFIYYC